MLRSIWLLQAFPKEFATAVSGSDRCSSFGVITMSAKTLALGLVALLVSGRVALADEGLGSFHYVAEEAKPVAPGKPIAARKKPRVPTKKPAVENKAATEPWGPVPTDKLSLVNVAPVLLPFFNNGPVFGVPGTVVGDVWSRTQLTGDWGGLRTDW